MRLWVVAAVSAALLLTGCGSATGGDDRVQVAASFYPYAFVAQRVGGAHVHVDNLTAPGVEPHVLELKPRQVGAVQDADLLIYQRGFQAAVDSAVDQADRAADDTIDVRALITPQRRQGDTDPHLWLDPHNLARVSAAVRDDLVRLDPAHEPAYAANAARLQAELTALDGALAAGLRTCRTRTIVTSHAAFGYLTGKYGLEQISIAGIDPGNEPSPAQLAQVARIVEQQQLTTIFSEQLVSPAVARTVARETGATVATLDPIEGLSAHTARENYLTLMAKNLSAIARANGCR